MPTDTFQFRETPWWTFYARPRSTFEHILKEYPAGYSVMMALTAGFGLVLQHLFMRGVSARDLPGAIYLEAFILGPILGVFCFFFAGWLYTLIGNRLDGDGTMERNRVAWAWSFVPFLTGMVLLWIPLTIAAVTRVQLHGHLSDWADHVLLDLEIFFYYAFVPFWGWSVYLLVLGLSVANRFSIQKAVISVMVSYVVVGVMVWLLYMIANIIGAL